MSSQKQPAKRRLEVLLPASQVGVDARPIRAETRATLVAAIARGRHWLNEIVTTPGATAEAIAQRESCSGRKVNMTISLAFLSPALVKAALEGRLPRGVGVTRLCDSQLSGSCAQPGSQSRPSGFELYSSRGRLRLFSNGRGSAIFTIRTTSSRSRRAAFFVSGICTSLRECRCRYFESSSSGAARDCARRGQVTGESLTRYKTILVAMTHQA